VDGTDRVVEATGHRGLTRAGLFKAGTAVAVAAGLGGAGRALARGAGAAALSSSLGKPGSGPDYLQRRTYLPLVGNNFRLTQPGSRTLRLKLIDAKEFGDPGESFSLLFRGRVDPGTTSGTYRVEHPQLGQFDLFMGPVGRGVKGLDLEAVINRIAI
jgi:hypothetical protein